jgi:hypothetical protein
VPSFGKLKVADLGVNLVLCEPGSERCGFAQLDSATNWNQSPPAVTWKTYVWRGKVAKPELNQPHSELGIVYRLFLWSQVYNKKGM